LLSIVLLSAVLVFRLLTRKPILGYIIGEWDCACGVWHEKVTRGVIWNPLRDRSPEHAANAFLLGLRSNQCNARAEVCRGALVHRRVSNWELRFRENEGQSSFMYFVLTHIDRSENVPELSGQGVVTAKFQDGRWLVVGYDTIF